MARQPLFIDGINVAGRVEIMGCRTKLFVKFISTHIICCILILFFPIPLYANTNMPYENHIEYGLNPENFYLHIEVAYKNDFFNLLDSFNLAITPFPDRITNMIIWSVFYEISFIKIEKVSSNNFGVTIFFNNLIPYTNVLRDSIYELYFWGSILTPNINLLVETGEKINFRYEIFIDFWLIKPYWGQSIDIDGVIKYCFGIKFQFPVPVFQDNFFEFINSQFDERGQ